jgi:hypothetical protein
MLWGTECKLSSAPKTLVMVVAGVGIVITCHEVVHLNYPQSGHLQHHWLYNLYLWTLAKEEWGFYNFPLGWEHLIQDLHHSVQMKTRLVINRFLRPGLICRDQSSILKFKIAPVFHSKKIKFELKQELTAPALGWYAEINGHSWSSDLLLFFSVTKLRLILCKN